MTPRQFTIRLAREWKRQGRPIESFPRNKNPQLQELFEAEYHRFKPRKIPTVAGVLDQVDAVLGGGTA